MPLSHASVPIATPARYMARLCNHFAHRMTVHREAERARIEFPTALCLLQVTGKRLEMRIEAADAADLDRLEEVVGRHLRQVASAEAFEVHWVRSDS